MKISERDREEAIEACLLTAEWWTTGADTHPLSLTVVRVAVHDLGFEAIHAVESAMGGPESHEAGAVRALEAAALLRDGWNPGDPVEVRR